MRSKEHYLFAVLLWLGVAYSGGCSKNQTTGGLPPTPPVTSPPAIQTDVAFWLTRADGLIRFQKQQVSLVFTDTVHPGETIMVDSAQQYQFMDGFGCALTQGSAFLINHLQEVAKDALLKELFTTDSNFIGISYLRISLGASDLSTRVYSYDDLPAGQTDSALAHFGLGEDLKDLVPVLQKIIALDPGIKILASPWSAPVWMKTNGNAIGGSLRPAFYSVYAQYFVKYIEAMKASGINIDAVTMQNEPLNPYNNPSMVMQAPEQALFLKDYLGPAFGQAGITAKIILNENNPDLAGYPLSILADPEAYRYADGSAFHLYSGDISGLSVVHNVYPEKGIYFTEEWVGAPGDFAAYLNAHIKLLTIGATRNWSKNVLEWNLASDPGYNPHTAGGCNNCLGAVTIGDTVTRNVGYYIMAHASKFVRPGSVRIGSTMPGSLPNVAFLTPGGKKVLIVLNDSQQAQAFNISYHGKAVFPLLPAGAVGTFSW